MQHPSPRVDVPDVERTGLLAPQSMVEQDREDRPIPLALLCLGPRRIEEGPRLSVVGHLDSTHAPRTHRVP